MTPLLSLHIFLCNDLCSFVPVVHYGNSARWHSQIIKDDHKHSQVSTTGIELCSVKGQSANHRVSRTALIAKYLMDLKNGY